MAQATARRPRNAARKSGAGASDPSKGAAPAPRPWSHGQFFWNELRTRNAERAIKFYAETVGWEFDNSCTPDGFTYWIARCGGKPVAGLFPLDSSPRFDGVPESWMSFLAVDDVDARAARAAAAGARLVMPVFDVPGVGRIAMLLEPSGAGVGWITPVGPQAGKGGSK
jgi:predicted enzyme related to lactoylglutathione lyase